MDSCTSVNDRVEWDRVLQFEFGIGFWKKYCKDTKDFGTEVLKKSCEDTLCILNLHRYFSEITVIITV